MKQQLHIAQSNSVAEEMAENSFVQDIFNLYLKKLNLASEQLDSKVFEPLIIALEDEDEKIRDFARRGLEELEYKFK